MKILMLDDNSKNMKQVADEIELDGHEVVHVNDPNGLAEALGRIKYDGIILDLMFPPAEGFDYDDADSGYSAGVWLYEKFIYPSLPEVPFVILTAMDDSTDIFEKSLETLKKYPAYKKAFFKLEFKVDEIISVFCIKDK